MTIRFAQARATSIPASTERVLVDGVDITDFRANGDPAATPTRIPGYALMEPCGYGASQQLVIPRTHSYFEKAGAGDLAWCRKGAEVLYQRVSPTGEITVDYRGFVVATRNGDPHWVLDVWGQVSGRASLIQRQNLKVGLVKDIGHWVSLALAEVNVAMSPALGPVTGLPKRDEGGQTLLAWLDKLGALSQDRDGNQRAVMPSPWGSARYRFDVKDTTTKHYTVFADGTRIRLDLVDDLTEQPNTYFGSGVDANGTRWDNSRYPGIIEGPAPRYPFGDNRNFGIGTTDADTDRGDGITVLRIKLLSMGYLDLGDQVNAVYNQAMADAVEELKHDAGLSANGTMTPNAWKALWDVDVTGFSNVGAAMFPIVQAPAVQKWIYSANGSIIGRNPAFDPTAPRVDQTYDFGAGVSKSAGTNYARGQMTKAAGKNWAGTITANGVGVFAGEWGPEDVEFLMSDAGKPYVRSLRDVRPGQNLWLPQFDDGTLVHVAGADLNPGQGGSPDSATWTVDTQARGLLTLTEILARNKDGHRDLRREWIASNRGSKPSGNMVSRDEHFGILDRDVKLKGGRWNTVRVIIGQSGTVNRIRLRAVSSKAEFCFIVLSAEVTATQLARRLGNPFPVDATTGEGALDRHQADKWFEDRIVLFAAGNAKQPCGYGRRKKFGNNDARTSAPLTGTYLHDEPWSYLSAGDRRPFVTIGIYPDRDCTIKGGRIFDALPDDVV